MEKMRTLIISLLCLSTSIAMDGDDKYISDDKKPLKLVSSTFKDSIEDAIDKFVRSEEAREVEARLAKRQLAAHKKTMEYDWKLRDILSDIRRKEIQFQLHDKDSLDRLTASTQGLHVQKLQSQKRPQTGFKLRYDRKK